MARLYSVELEIVPEAAEYFISHGYEVVYRGGRVLVRLEVGDYGSLKRLVDFVSQVEGRQIGRLVDVPSVWGEEVALEKE